MTREDKLFWRKIYLKVGMRWFTPPTLSKWDVDEEHKEEFTKFVEEYESVVTEPFSMDIDSKFDTQFSEKSGLSDYQYLKQIKFKQEFVDKFFAE